MRAGDMTRHDVRHGLNRLARLKWLRAIPAQKLLQIKINNFKAFSKSGKGSCAILAQSDPTNSPLKPTILRSFMDGFITLTTELEPGAPEDRKAVSAMYRRHSKAAKDLLALAKNDPNRALAAVRSIASRMESRNLSWSLEGIFKHYHDWATSPEVYDAETKNKRRRY